MHARPASPRGPSGVTALDVVRPLPGRERGNRRHDCRCVRSSGDGATPSLGKLHHPAMSPWRKADSIPTTFRGRLDAVHPPPSGGNGPSVVTTHEAAIQTGRTRMPARDQGGRAHTPHCALAQTNTSGNSIPQRSTQGRTKRHGSAGEHRPPLGTILPIDGVEAKPGGVRQVLRRQRNPPAP